MTRRAWIIASLAALGACASLPPPAPAPAPPPAPPSIPSPPQPVFELLEPLLGVRAFAEGLVIRVRSNGCTTKADFVFYVDRRGPTPTLAFGRRRVDACKAPSTPLELFFSFAELGLAQNAPVVVVNPRAGP
jgi:hypothetical protein